jgi:hypothetical protein
MAKITNLSPPARETEGVARGCERGPDDGIGTRFLARLTHFGNVGWQIVSSGCALRHQKTIFISTSSRINWIKGLRLREGDKACGM